MPRRHDMFATSFTDKGAFVWINDRKDGGSMSRAPKTRDVCCELSPPRSTVVYRPPVPGSLGQWSLLKCCKRLWLRNSRLLQLRHVRFILLGPAAPLDPCVRLCARGHPLGVAHDVVCPRSNPQIRSPPRGTACGFGSKSQSGVRYGASSARLSTLFIIVA
ncbi:hypothetical protein C8Q80DRAFT_750366 [Daedaleopsis nitida]|nr:hypothetical protein C8Q80DRAFT_750366 [Daedaleopsis nitida]